MGNGEAVKQQLAAGKDVNKQNELGEAALHFLAHMDLEFAELLITKKAAVNVINDTGNTALD